MTFRQMLCCTLALLQLTQSAPVRADQTNTPPVTAPLFTPEQQDRILIDHLIRANDKSAYEFSAIAYSVWAAGRNYEKDPATHVEQWDPPSTTVDIWGIDGWEFQVTKEQFMNRAADAEQKSIEGFQVRGTWGEPVIDAVLGVTGVIAAPELGASVPIVLPIAKEVAVRALSVSPNDPTLSLQVTRESWAWAMEQVRQGTPEGKILEPYLNKRKIPDPREDRSDTEAVEQAEMKSRQLKTDEDVKNLLENNADLKRVLTEVQRAYADQAKNLQNTPLPAPNAPIKISVPKSQELTEFFGGASKNLDSLSLILSVTNHAKEAEMVARAAKAAKAMEMISKAQEMSGLAAANVYLYAAVMVYECIAISQKPGSPYPAIFAMLQQISVQIEKLRVELGTRLNQIDTKFSALFAKSIALDEAALHDIQAVSHVVSLLQTQLRQFRSESRTQILELANIALEDQDNQCIQETGRGVLLPMSQSEFILCRDRFISRGTRFAKSDLASSVNGVFAFGDSYEKLRLVVDPQGQEYRSPLANPAVWLQSSYLMSRLVQGHPEYLSDLEDPHSIDLRIAPLMQGGQDLESFANTLLFRPDGSFRSERIALLLDEAQNVQVETLNVLAPAIAASGLNVDPSKKMNQDFNMDFPFQMFAQPIPFCEGVNPRLTSVVDIGFALGGGGSGGYAQLSDSNLQAILTRSGLSVDIIKNMVINEFAGTPHEQFTWSRFILQRIAKEVVLMEQSGFRDAKITPCVFQMDFGNLNQYNEANFAQDISVGLRIKLTMTLQGVTQEVPVQELTASANLTGTSGGGIMFHLNDHSRYGGNVIGNNNWENFRNALVPLLNDASSAESAANRQVLVDQFNQFLVDHQEQILDTNKGVIDDKQARFEEVVRNLHAMTAIGMESGSETFAAWDSTIDQALASLSPKALSTLMVSEGKSIAEAAAQIGAQREVINASVGAVAQDKTLHAPNRFNAGLMWLRQIYLAKSIGTGSLN